MCQLELVLPVCGRFVFTLHLDGPHLGALAYSRTA